MYSNAGEINCTKWYNLQSHFIESVSRVKRVKPNLHIYFILLNYFTLKVYSVGTFSADGELQAMNDDFLNENKLKNII